jgi:multidrug resistance efflux pump
MLGYKFIKGIFWFHIGFLTCTGILLFTLNINESVRIEEGELIAKTPRFVHKALSDVRVVSSFIKEGDRVTEGQVLMILDDRRGSNELRKVETEYESLISELKILENLLGNAEKSINHYQTQIRLFERRFETDRKRNDEELSSLKAQLEILEKENEIAAEKFRRTEILHKKELISKVEYESGHQEWLNAKKRLYEMKNRYELQKINAEILELDFKNNLATLKMQMLNTESNRLNLLERQLELNKTIQKQHEELEYYRHLMSKQKVVSEITGTVRYVCDTKSISDNIGKGEILVEVAPDSSDLYAKLLIKQEDIRGVHPGQTAYLKLNAYYYYVFGVLKGKVNQILPSNDKNEFFIIVEIDSKKDEFKLRPGYKVRGEIVIGELKLYKFLLKKAFKKLWV